MSRYLIERIEATPNIELLFNTEVAALAGDGDASLSRVRSSTGPPCCSLTSPSVRST